MTTLGWSLPPWYSYTTTTSHVMRSSTLWTLTLSKYAKTRKRVIISLSTSKPSRRHFV